MLSSAEERIQLWSSRDITLVIILAVVALIYSALMIQIPRFITGIPGLGYFTGFGIVIILNIAFLLFEGRRWRFFFVVALERIILSAIFVHMRPLLFLRTVPLLTGKFII